MHDILVTTHHETTRLTLTTPILKRAILENISAVLETLAGEDEPQPLVICSSHPSIFLAGAHLAEIARLDSASSVPYALQGRRVVQSLESHPAPTVAAVGGSCSGGGFDLVLACDAVVAGHSATFSHPGVRRGLVTGWSGTVKLPAALGCPTARAALLEGRELDPAEMRDLGVVHIVCNDPVAEATRTALELAGLDPERRRLWRTLRKGRFVDSFRASVVENY